MSSTDIEGLYQFKRPPLLIVFSGTSGSGKDSVVRALVQRMQPTEEPVHFVITATSRPRREHEVHGVDYFFVSRPEFERMIADDELIEYALVYDQYKGIPKQQVRNALASGQDVVMRLDVQGAATIRQLAPDAVLVFITASSEQELTERLRKRRTESKEQLAIRVQTARDEMRRIPEFDYLIRNVDRQLECTVDTAVAILTAERCRTRPRRIDL